MLPFGVTIPATVPQRSEIPEGLINYPVYLKCQRRNVLRGSGYPTLLCNILTSTNSCMYHNFTDLLHSMSLCMMKGFHSGEYSHCGLPCCIELSQSVHRYEITWSQPRKQCEHVNWGCLNVQIFIT